MGISCAKKKGEPSKAQQCRPCISTNLLMGIVLITSMRPFVQISTRQHDCWCHRGAKEIKWQGEIERGNKMEWNTIQISSFTHHGWNSSHAHDASPCVSVVFSLLFESGLLKRTHVPCFVAHVCAGMRDARSFPLQPCRACVRSRQIMIPALSEIQNLLCPYCPVLHRAPKEKEKTERM